MNYIITGGTGFIGAHLASALAAQCPEANIYNLDIVAPGSPLPTIKNYKSPYREGQQPAAHYVHCDVRQPIVDLPFTPTPDDVIFNLAAVHRTPGHPDFDYFQTNIRGAENVCAFAEKWGIKQIVFTSSIAPYGAAEELKTEETLPTPNTPYGISKLVAEKIHIAWQNGAADRRLTIVRPGVVFGKGENGNFTRLYWGVRKRKFVYPGRRDTIKACIYVKELVSFMLWSLTNQQRGVEVTNCTFEPAYRIDQIVDSMQRQTRMNNCVPLIPSWLLMLGAYVLGMLGAPMGICPERVKKLMISTNICGRKLASSGYKFRYTLDAAISDWLADNDGKWLE